MPSFVYTKGMKNFLGSVDWLNDTIKVALLTSSYTPQQTTHEFFSAVSTFEVTGTGYTAGGATLANKTATTSSNVAVLNADNVTWSNSTITARYAVIYKDTGTPSTSPLLACVDFGSNYASSNGNFTIQWDATGIIRVTT